MKIYFTLYAYLFSMLLFLPGKSLQAQTGFEIPAMTKIALEIESNPTEIEKLTEGSRLIFRVKNNLSYPKQQLILAGTYAEGYIAHIEKTDRACYKIEIKPDFMKMQDGQLIRFFPTSHFLEIGECLRAVKVSKKKQRIIVRVRETEEVWID